MPVGADTVDSGGRCRGSTMLLSEKHGDMTAPGRGRSPGPRIHRSGCMGPARPHTFLPILTAAALCPLESPGLSLGPWSFACARGCLGPGARASRSSVPILSCPSCSEHLLCFPWCVPTETRLHQRAMSWPCRGLLSVGAVLVAQHYWPLAILF